MIRWALLLVLCFGTTATASQRWALVIGENRGLAGEEPLRFAEDDAQRMAATLQELSGVPVANTVVVAGGDAAVVREALSRMEERMRKAGETQDRLVVYISSHAGDGELHLRNTTLPLNDVVAFLKRAPARVGLLIVDACRSGAMTGTKGLRPVQAPVWTAEVAPLEGRILISASGADEFAQESDVLGGSYFTHHLITGLRGAADSSGDGRVTLDEAYRWAWSRTVESTFSTKAGVQTPAFKVELRGQGELVLTELRRARSTLRLNVDSPGRWLVVDSASGSVSADVEKGRGPVSLAVAPGEYRVRLRSGAGYLEKSVVVSRGETVELTRGDFESAPLVRTALKGRDASLYVLSAAAHLSSAVVGGLGATPGVEARLRMERDWFGAVNQLTFSVAGRDATSATLAFRQSELELKAGVGHRWEWTRVTASVALEAGPLFVFQGGLPDGTSRTSLGAASALNGEVRFHLFGPVDLFAGVQGGPALLKKTRGLAAVLRASAGAGAAISF